MRRKRKQLARNRKCDPRRRPKPKATPCNTFPCPVSSWEPNPWSACSSTCGTGHQTRTFLCVRAGQPVEVTECEGRPTEPEVQECDAGPCPANARWQIGQWSPCSVSCDWGSRTRRVSCAEPGRCPATERPRDTAPCRLQPCPQQVHSDHRPAGWMTTDWTDQCSVECGQGVQWRGVTCGGDVGRCQPGSRPQQTRPCKTDRGCGGIWFTGPWSQCSHECGDGGQATRTVLCIRRTDAEFAVAAERACAATARPPDRQPCGGGAGCPPRWFVTEWAACSATCGIGRQRRTVACPASWPTAPRWVVIFTCGWNGSSLQSLSYAATTGQPVTEGSLPTGQTEAAGSAPTADAASPDGTPPPTVVDESVEQRPSILTLDESTLGGWRGTTNANKSVEQRPSVLTLDEATVGGWRGSTNTWITVDAPTPTEAGPVGSTEPTGVGATELGSSSEPTAAAVSRELELGSGGLDPINTATSAAATEALAGGAEPTRLPSETLPAGELERETPATNQPEEQLPTNELESELLETNELDGEPRFTFELDEKPPSANGLRGAPFPGQAPAENTLVTDGSAATTEGLANPRKHRKHKDRGGRREGRKEGSGSGASANNTDSCTDKFSYCSLVQQARLCKYKYYKNSCCAACRGAR
ncbi:A disintegrin and metalloproteinase with thrombospondin motifs 7-like [Pollicipes pollicipes]|uniref:A disintegrin and metalloproteinase with thrombospondin motifs 7-like n=1 Tax=Pollicipes pollicipes TaxID=41117 RepID=UPI001884DD1F|nr:A disintegrin and metalloproteinase with thrombospondin motifs 7-like [Pollicipes pollicipes]